MQHSYTYDANGNLESLSYSNGVIHNWSYDSQNRLKDLTVRNAAFTTLHSYAYTLQASGHRSQVVEANGRTVGYTLDNQYRLTQEAVSGDPSVANGTSDWEYDLVGNRLTQQSDLDNVFNAAETYSDNNWLHSHSYDANGNTTRSAQLQQASVILNDDYDWRNRLIRREKSDGSIIEIVYDGFGDRIKKTISGLGSPPSGFSSTWFLVDRNNLTGYAQVVEEIGQGDELQVIYSYGLDLISQDRRDDDGSGNFTQSFYLYDGLGSVRALADSSGVVTDTYTYDAWGVEVHSTGNTVNAYRFTGEQWDDDLQMVFLRARYLNVATGRFHTMDTFEGVSTDPVTLHKYLYANAAPNMWTDPSGNITLVQLTVGLFVAGLVLEMASRTFFPKDNADELKAFQESIVNRRFDIATCYSKYNQGVSIVFRATVNNSLNKITGGIAKAFFLTAATGGVALAGEIGLVSVAPFLVKNAGKISGGLAAFFGFNGLKNSIQEGSEFSNKLVQWRDDCSDRRAVAVHKETGYPIIEITE